MYALLPSLIFDILDGLTKIIDIIAITIITISVLQFLVVAFQSKLSYFAFRKDDGRLERSYGKKKEKNSAIKNFIKGILLALEFESANAIIKLGIFMSKNTMPESFTNNFKDFAFFIGILLLKIAINQSLRRFRIAK